MGIPPALCCPFINPHRDVQDRRTRNDDCIAGSSASASLGLVQHRISGKTLRQVMPGASAESRERP